MSGTLIDQGDGEAPFLGLLDSLSVLSPK